MQSGLARMWLFLPLLGRAAVGSVVLGCSGGAPALTSAEAPSERPGTTITAHEQSAQSVPTPAAPGTEAPKPTAPAMLIAGPVRTLTIAPLIARRSTLVVPEASVKTLNVPLQCAGAVSCPTPTSNVSGWVQLDEHVPRPWSLGRPLISLLNEDEEIAPGEHTLLAAVFTPEKIHADAASFRVEPARRSQAALRSVPPPALETAQPKSAEGPPAQAACFLFLPKPTVNGEGDRELELLAVLLEVHGIDQWARSRVEQAEHEVVIHYTATGQNGVARGSFPQGKSALLQRPFAGDLRINVSCELNGKELASSERTVTLNPELTGTKK